MKLGLIPLVLWASLAGGQGQPARLTHDAVVHRTWEASSETIGRLRAGAEVTVTSQRGCYSHTQSPDVDKGWVYSRYLEDADTPALSVPPAPAPTTAVGVDGLKT